MSTVGLPIITMPPIRSVMLTAGHMCWSIRARHAGMYPISTSVLPMRGQRRTVRCGVRQACCWGMKNLAGKTCTTVVILRIHCTQRWIRRHGLHGAARGAVVGLVGIGWRRGLVMVPALPEPAAPPLLINTIVPKLRHRQTDGDEASGANQAEFHAGLNHHVHAPIDVDGLASIHGIGEPT